MSDGWKTVAIILLVVFILENALIFWGLKLVSEDTNRENECTINVCAEHEAYLYDHETQICECYDDGMLMKQEFIK